VSSNFDPLEYALAQGEKYDLKIHAWINVYLLWSAPAPPALSSHLLHLRPDWTDSDFLGVRDLDRDWKVYKNGMAGGIYLSPTHPEVNDYLLKVVREIVDNYPVDGIHYDYIRYQGITSGFNETGRQNFYARYGVDPLEMNEIPENSMDLEGVYNEVWRNYRKNRITDFVRAVHNMIQSDAIEISAAVKPDIRRATDYFLQDWPEWIEKGYLDFAVPMNYTPEMSTFQDNSMAIMESISKTSVVMGVGAYNQTEYSVSQKVQYTLQNRFKGVCIFSYDSLIEDPSYMTLLKPYFSFAD
jgi:uncharacterized lipoprotein YddW (UPF0748 family)